MLNALAIVSRSAYFGIIKRARECDFCFDCGKPPTQYDHRDYRKPLDIDPVCNSCNRRRGAALPYLNKSVTGIRRQFSQPHEVRKFLNTKFPSQRERWIAETAHFIRHHRRKHGKEGNK